MSILSAARKPRRTLADAVVDLKPKAKPSDSWPAWTDENRSTLAGAAIGLTVHHVSGNDPEGTYWVLEDGGRVLACRKTEAGALKWAARHQEKCRREALAASYRRVPAAPSAFAECVGEDHPHSADISFPTPDLDDEGYPTAAEQSWHARAFYGGQFLADEEMGLDHDRYEEAEWSDFAQRRPDLAASLDW